MTFELESAAFIKFKTEGLDEFSSVLSLVKKIEWKSQMLTNRQYKNHVLLFCFCAGDRGSAGDGLLFAIILLFILNP